jgi:hypothetical protein
MKILSTSYITDTAQMPIKGGTLAFLQQANQEVFAAIMQQQIGNNYNSNYGYILWGCLNTGTGSNYIISDGAVLFNGEVFLVDAVNFTLTGENVAIGVITTTQYITDADPVTFTDEVSRNVHNIRKIVFQQGLSGTTNTFNYANAVNMQYMPQGGIGQTIEWTMPGSGDQNTLLATYFDPTSYQGIHPLTLGWIITDMGNVSVGYLPSDPNFGTIGATGGEAQHTLTESELPEFQVEIEIPAEHYTTSDGGSDHPYGAATPAVRTDTLTSNTVGSGAAHNNLQPYVVVLKIQRYA